MSSTCLEPDDPSSGRRLYIQLCYGRFYRHQYKQSGAYRSVFDSIGQSGAYRSVFDSIEQSGAYRSVFDNIELSGAYRSVFDCIAQSSGCKSVFSSIEHTPVPIRLLTCI
jgi:hypothetical protein